jgi:hypothetical protein
MLHLRYSLCRIFAISPPKKGLDKKNKGSFEEKNDLHSPDFEFV